MFGQNNFKELRLMALILFRVFECFRTQVGFLKFLRNAFGQHILF